MAVAGGSVADVREIVSYTLRLVSADTPTATYAAELTEVADSSPTLLRNIARSKSRRGVPRRGRSMRCHSPDAGSDPSFAGSEFRGMRRERWRSGERGKARY